MPLYSTINCNLGPIGVAVADKVHCSCAITFDLLWIVDNTANCWYYDQGQEYGLVPLFQKMSMLRGSVTVKTPHRAFDRVRRSRAGTGSYKLTRDPTRVNRKWYPLCNNNIWNPLLICAIIEASDLVHNLGLLRQLLGPKLTGTGLPEHPENFGSAYLFLQPLNLTTSTLVRNFGLGIVACQKTLGSKLAGSRLQQHLKICGTPMLFTARCYAQRGLCCRKMPVRTPNCLNNNALNKMPFVRKTIATFSKKNLYNS